HLDLAGKEPVLTAGKGAGVCLLHVLLDDVGDEVAGHAHVEEQLAAAALLVERERLSGTEQVGRRRRRRLPLRIGGLWRRGRRRRRWRGRWRRRWLRLQALEPLGQSLQLLAQLLDLTSQRAGILRDRRCCDEHERDDDEEDSHGNLPVAVKSWRVRHGTRRNDDGMRE